MANFIRHSIALLLWCAAGGLGLAQTVSADRLAPCLACHGEQQSTTAEVPSIGGQPAYYALIQLFMFRERLRVVDVMNEAIKDFSNDDLQAFSEAIARLPAPQPVGDAGDPTRVERAKRLVTIHHCAFCHNADLFGRENVPRLAAQREDYLIKTLREYKANTRPGYDAAMANVTQPLTDGDILDLAHYLARVR